MRIVPSSLTEALLLPNTVHYLGIYFTMHYNNTSKRPQHDKIGHGQREAFLNHAAAAGNAYDYKGSSCSVQPAEIELDFAEVTPT